MASPAFPKLRGADAQQSRVQDNVSAQLQPIAQALSVTPIMGTVPQWIASELLNGWVNFGSPFATAAYYKDALMRVWSRGTLSNPTGAPLAAVVLKFPLGLRPAQRQRLPVVGDSGTFNFLTVDVDGTVTPGGTAIPSPGSLDLFFSFLADA